MARMQDFSRFRSDLILGKITSCKLLILLTYYNYEFWLSLCKIVQSSVILLLPLITDITDITDISECCDIPQKKEQVRDGIKYHNFFGCSVIRIVLSYKSSTNTIRYIKYKSEIYDNNQNSLIYYYYCWAICPATSSSAIFRTRTSSIIYNNNTGMRKGVGQTGQ